MKYNKEKVDEVSLALLFLSLDDNNRAWKGMDWDVSNRLYEKGWIENPRNKNKTFVLTDLGREMCIKLFEYYFYDLYHKEMSTDQTGEISIPVDMEALALIYKISEADTHYYLNLKTGVIEDEISGKPDLGSGNTYARIPSLTDTEYLAYVRQFLSMLTDNDLRLRLETLIESSESGENIADKVRSILVSNSSWSNWYHKRIRKHIREWLISLKFDI